MAKSRAEITLYHVIDIEAVNRYYLLQSSTLAKPSKPTVYPPEEKWTAVEPTYTDGSTNSLYTVDCTVFCDGSFKYSEVSLSSSYEAAKAAYNKANSIESVVVNLETRIDSNEEAIELRATKDEVTEALGDYYTKTETDAAIDVTADEINLTVSAVRTTADDAIATANSIDARVTASEVSFKLLSDSISSLITDENGNSLMTQTSTGWEFNIGGITNTLEQTVSDLSNLSGDVNEIDSTVTDLNSAIEQINDKTAYIIMGKDDNGDPCIELGKEGSPFRVRITNTSVDFIEGSFAVAYINNESLNIEQAIVKNDLKIGEDDGFIWKKRQTNGNMGLRWVSGV